MGEMKVLNKYYPADFDPVKIPRRKQPKNQQIKVRMMLPMRIRCNTCGNYIYKGTKFNSRKEDVIGETYLGIQIFRFYFKCTKCSSEIIMKTDSQNSDYVVEYVAKRNLDLWGGDDEQVENKKRKRNAEEMGDTMKSLENRTLDSKREIDIFAALDELKSMKSRHAIVSVDAMLDQLLQEEKEKEKKLEEEDEALIFQRSRVVRRIQDKDFSDDYEDLALFPTDNGETSSNDSKRRTNGSIKGDPTGPGASSSSKFIFKSSSVRVSVIKKPPTKEESRREEEHNATNITSNELQSLCQHYESEEEY